MKRFTFLFLALAFLTTHSLRADDCDWLAEGNREMNALHNAGSGCEDGIYSAISASMIAWGVGLFAGIALLTGLFHSHSASSSNSSSSSTSTN